MPLVTRLLGDALKKVEVEKGISGSAPGSAPANVIICHLYFDSLEDFQNTFGPNAKEILDDIINFTHIAPVAQISEVLI